METTQLQYGVSIRFVMDATGSMTPILDLVKRDLLSFPTRLSSALAAKGKTVGKLLVGVDVYRDVYVDGDDAFASSPFYDMATEQAALQTFVDGIRPINGGDEPENGLEGVGNALNAKWPTDMAKQRHVVVVYTDASAHPLEKGAASSTQRNYPPNMPKSFGELTDRWSAQSMDRHAKRLILFAPDAYPWTDMATHWENTVHYASRAGEGLSEIDSQTILDAIVNSIAV